MDARFLGGIEWLSLQRIAKPLAEVMIGGTGGVFVKEMSILRRRILWMLLGRMCCIDMCLIRAEGICTLEDKR